MPTKKYKQKLMKHRVCFMARIVACASFLVLTIIGVSSIVRAMSLETIANENGIPAIWKAASLGNPETITIPITYWDQREDDCEAENRQFEWSLCRLYAKGIIQNVVKSQLGADGLPVPTYTNNSDAWNAYHDVFTANVTGHDPVVATDNFYRWFHETYDESGKQLSKRYDREVTFTRTGQNSYEYGSKGTFPLDDVNFSNEDSATATGHNFHFTAHMTIPMKISADGTEQFWFSGDDDVWVFLNGQLVLDLGGLHMDTEGNFTIDKNGNVISTVNNVADADCRREKVKSPLVLGYDMYNNQVERACPRETKTQTIYTGFESGQVVNLDFFYAERSTSESNTRINITNMNWPISADSNLEAKIVGKIPDTESNLVEFTSSITNRDPENPLDLERLAAFIHEDSIKDGSTTSSEGYLPLDSKTLYYTTTPNDPDSWKPVEISAPDNTETGFNLAEPIRMAPHGNTGDTLYFRYYGETAETSGTLTSQVNFYTSLNGASGVTYDYDSVSYTVEKPVDPNPPVDPDPETYTVSISYLYSDDQTTAADPYSKDLKPGESFEVPSPFIDGYTPDLTLISGTVKDSNLSYIVYYTKNTPVTPPDPVDPDPIPHQVTIKYIYEDGTPAASSYVEDLYPGDDFSVASPVIDGYTPDQSVVAGTIDEEDLEYTVIYKKNPEPEQPDNPGPVDPTPDTPDEPTIPDKPDTPVVPDFPTVPEIPGSDIIPGDLTYLGPLGEVAYVPNTGIVSDVFSSIFDQGFAEIILSQGFVMIMLLIFAGSFATYFSLRGYLNLDLAPVTRNSTAGRNATNTRAMNNRKTKSMPKSLKNSSKKSMSSQKISRNSAKTAKK